MSALHHSPESLIYAVMSRDIRQVQKLLNFGIVINPSDAWIIYDACLQGPDMIQALASDPNIDLNPTVPQQNGDRVFHFLLRTPCAQFRHNKYETIKALLQIGIDPFLPGRRGNTAIHILAGATDEDGLRLLEVLIRDQITASDAQRRGSILDVVNKAGNNTALIIAVQRNNEHQARLLLENGASPHIRGELGRSALYYAVARNFIGIAELLMGHGATIGNDIVPLSQDMENVLSCYCNK